MKFPTRSLGGHCCTVAIILLGLAWAPPAGAQGTYTASWTSLDQHVAAPTWWQDAKFGIYYHWGAFCVAQYGSEWYPRNMYNKGGNSIEYQHHVATYGDPFGNWPFNNFLTGANDKSGKLAIFAPKQVADGGKWDPDAWAQLFVDSGARFAGPVAEHHDGFSMWDSKVNPWNSVSYGPKLNLAKIQADAMRRHGLKLLMSQHTAYNFTGFYEYAPAQTDPKLQQLFGQLPKAQEETIWLGKLKEVIDEFLPDVIWQDFNLWKISDASLTAFLAYYYNAAAKAGVDVVATAKDGIVSSPPGYHKGQVFDYERGGPADITTPYWLTDDAVSPSSWSYTQGMAYYAVNAEVHSFIDHVSKGGNLLLNISPLPDGTIPQQQKDILNGFGAFLKVAGEAIYKTRAWTVYGEGPTKIGGGSFTGPKAMTSADIRYTRSNEKNSATDYDAVYAILGGWPTGGKVTMTSVTSSRFPLGSGNVYLFAAAGGQPTVLQATQDGSGLHVTMPATAPYTALAYAIKISKSGTPPAPPEWIGGGTDGGVPATGGSSGTQDAAPADARGGAGSGGTGGAGGATDASSGGATGSSGGATGSSGGATGSSGGATSGTGGSGQAGAQGSGGAGPAASGGSGGTPASGGRGAGGLATGGAASGGTPGTSAGQGGSGTGGSTGASTGTAGSSSGCSCAVEGHGRAGLGTLVALGLVVSGLAHRRRRRSGRGQRRRFAGA